MSIDAIYWMRLSVLKTQLDALTSRVTHLEQKSMPGEPPPRMGTLKRLMDILSMITTAHGALPWIWPALLAALGIGWKIITKAFS